jgi:hypothetical protein
MWGERSQSKSKHSIFGSARKKLRFAIFFGEASFALCSEVTRPQLMLGTDWEMAIYENLFRCGFGEH